MTKIPPSIGRNLLFLPAIDDGRHEDGQPFACILAGINADATINLGVFARDGSPYGVQNVLLVQPGDEADLTKAHAFWMPFQLGQAAKTEAAIGAAGGQPVDLTAVHQKIDGVVQDLTAKVEQVAAAAAPAALHDKVTTLEQSVDGKFKEVGDFLTASFKSIEDKFAAMAQAPAPAPAPATPPVGA